MPNPRPRNPDLIILYSLFDEIRFIRKKTTESINIETSLYFLGVGKKHAESRLDALSKSIRIQETRKLILVGFCGGLNPALVPGDLVEEHRNPRGDLISGRPGFFSSDFLVETVEAKLKLRASSGLDAVDMESATVREFARSEGLELQIIKAVLDEANFQIGIPAPVLFDMESQRTSFFRLAHHIARNPASLGRLAALASRSRKASQALSTRVGRLLAE
jgi:hypothetical protein